jgi:hypothetical protein
MLVTPLPGAAIDGVISALRDVHTAAINARGATSGHGGAGPTDAYLVWAGDSLRRLRGQLRPSDLDRLVLTRGYWSVLAQGAVAPQMVGPARAFVDLELDARSADLAEALAELQTRHERWARVGLFMVADTSFYIHCEPKLEEFDFARLLQVREAALHLLVPVLVVDELDGLKDRGNDRSRWRSSYTLAVVENRLRDPTGIGTLRQEDYSALNPGVGGTPRGTITVEVILDPAGHTRLPINDDELVDRAAAIQHASGREVAFLTNDTAQAFRARAAGLSVFKLPRPPLGDEPPNGPTKRKAQPAQADPRPPGAAKP